MRNILFVVMLFLFLGNNSWAQPHDSVSLNQRGKNNEEMVDTTETILNNFYDKEFTGHWAGVCFGFNNLLNRNYSTFKNQYGDFLAPEIFKSTTLEVNPFQFSWGLQQYRNTVGLVSGAGLEFVNYRIAPDIGLSGNSDRVVDPHYIQAIKNIKSKFSAVYITVPLLFEFQVPVHQEEERIFFSVGIIGKILADSYTKEKYISLENKKVIVKHLGNYGLRSYNSALSFRTGYRYLNLFAEYGLNSLFRKYGGPQVTPLTVGIALLLWD